MVDVAIYGINVFLMFWPALAGIYRVNTAIIICG
jgi:hypothetical protein